MQRFFLICSLFLPLFIWGFEDLVDLSTGKVSFEVIDMRVDGVIPLELIRTSDELNFPNGHLIQYEYDQDRRLTKIYSGDSWITFKYKTTSPYNYSMQALSSDGQELTYFFTKVSKEYKLTQVASQDHVIEDLLYSSNGQLVRRTINGTPIEFTYYERSGKVKSLKYSNETAFAFLYGTHQSEVIDQNYQKHLYEFDPISHALVKVEHVLSGDDSYSEIDTQIAQIHEETIDQSVEINLDEPTFEDIETPHPVYMALSEEIVFDKPYQIIKTNDRNQPIHLAFQDGTEVHFTYYSDGSYETYQSKEGLITYFSHDPHGRKPSRYVKSAEGKFLYKENYIYDSNHLIGMTDAIGNQFSYSYDSYGRKIKEETRECTTTYAYDQANRIIKITKTKDKDVFIATYSWNAMGQLETECHLDKDQNVILTLSRKYDHNNRLINILHTTNNETLEETYTYDQQGRLLRHCDTDGTILTYDHLDSGYKRLETSPQDFQIIKTYDANNFLNLVEYYSPDKTLLKSVRIEYDHLNRPIAQHEKSDKSKEKSTYYSYNALGQLEKSYDEKGLEISFTYDELGYLANLSAADGSISYTYEHDFLGNLKKITDEHSQNVTTRTYDSYGKLLTETLGHGLTVKRCYDARDAYKQLTLPDGTLLDYIYTGNKLQSITRKHPSGSMISTTSYQDQSENKMQKHLLLSSLSKKNAMRKPLNTYDLLGRLVEVIYPKISKYTFRYDGLGRCLTETEFVWTQKKAWKQKHTRHYFYDDLKEIGYTNEAGRIQDIYNLDARKSSQPHKLRWSAAFPSSIEHGITALKATPAP